jgi:hypothetical protein
MDDGIPNNNGPTFGTVSKIIELLDPLNVSDREHVMRTVATWFRVGLAPVVEPTEGSAARPISPSPARQNSPDEEKFSGRPVLSAKEFVLEKDPVTEVERLACLAYYMTHYQETPHFKNIDLSRLNTEAAQRKLSNPAVAISNAIRDGFFVQASEGGFKQLSAMGERFVQLLPDREATKKVKERMSSRRGRKSGDHVESNGKETGIQGE